MSEQLYRQRSVTQNPPKDGYYILIDPEYPNLADGFYFLDGDWYETETEARGSENPDALDVDGYFWLEPIDIDKVVEQLREENPYCGEIDFSEDARIAWGKSCDKLKELLNQKEGK